MLHSSELPILNLLLVDIWISILSIYFLESTTKCNHILIAVDKVRCNVLHLQFKFPKMRIQISHFSTQTEVERYRIIALAQSQLKQNKTSNYNKSP